MASTIDTIRLIKPVANGEMTRAVDAARERLLLDPRVDSEQMRDVEFVGGLLGAALYQVCAGTRAGDVLKVNIVIMEKSSS